VHDACEEIAARLDDEGLVFVAFIRHVCAHVYQDGFEYRIHGKTTKSLGTQQTVATVGRAVDVDEVHELVDRVLASHGGEEATAKHFASTVAQAIEKLFIAMENLQEQREADRSETFARQGQEPG
jgi:hypothetical protein